MTSLGSFSGAVSSSSGIPFALQSSPHVVPLPRNLPPTARQSYSVVSWQPSGVSQAPIGTAVAKQTPSRMIR